MSPKNRWPDRLKAVVDGVGVAGSFAWSSNLSDEDIFPELLVTDVGRITLPLGDRQAAKLLAAGEPAPYGKGPNTVLDPAVRRATQLDASRVKAKPAWESTLRDIASEATAALGMDSSSDIEARLYKLLLYQPGGHFAAHRDTEKEPGMFATLVVQLPVAGGHSGGTLRVSHRGQVFEWDSAAVSRSGHLAYAAFYADCEHELTAVTGGLRMVLVYNLVRTVPGSPLRAPPGGRAASAEALAAAVRGWEAAVEGPGTAPPRLLALPLEHKYTEANMSFSGLKGRDASVVELLAGCELLDVHLALVTKRVVGLPKESKRHGYDSWSGGGGWGNRWGGGWGSRWGSWYDEGEADEDDAEGSGGSDGESESPSDDSDTPAMQSVIDESIDARKWVRVTGPRIDLRHLAVNWDACLLPGGRLFDGSEGAGGAKPDEHEYEGYTGNEGPSLEYFYHRAVAVIWPRSRSAAITVAAGLTAATEVLEQQLDELLAAQQRSSPGGVQMEGNEEEKGEEEEQARRRRVAVRRNAAELLKAVLEMMEQSPQRAFSGYALAVGANAARALRIAALAPQVLGEAAESATGAARRVVAVLAASEGLASPAVVQALAAASTAAADPGLEAAVLDLLARCFERQFERCVQPVKEPAVPEALRSRVAEALMAAALGLGFARLQQGDVLAMARLVCEGGPLFQQHQAAFSAAVLARPDKQALMQALMREPCIATCAAAGAAPVLALAAERLRALEELVARGKPEFSWEQPNARLPDYPQVEAFLRGPEQQRTFKGLFQGVWDARGFADKLFSKAAMAAGRYSGKVEAGGRGRGAHVTITKDKRAFEADRKEFFAGQRELKALRAMAPSLAGGPAKKTGGRAGGSGGRGGGAAKGKAARSAAGASLPLGGDPAKVAKLETAGPLKGAGASVASAASGSKPGMTIDLTAESD